VDPKLFADPEARFRSPADLFIIPDHYVCRMLYSQGVPLEDLGVPRRDGGPVETDHRRIWRRFAERFHLFRGTPTGVWIREELAGVFGVEERLTAASADTIYDHLERCLARPEYAPRRLFERFRIEVLATTDAAHDPLDSHRAIRASGWPGRVIPTFRPDGVLNPDRPDWRDHLKALGAQCGAEITSAGRLIRALEERRAYFRAQGATAADHAALTPYTESVDAATLERIFARALRGAPDADDARRFTGHMLMECARMSVEDGLVMQLHAGSWRDHNPAVFTRFGTDKGADIPVSTEYTRNLKPLLDRFGNDPRLTLILFTLDESTYARELAPLAGHYPAVLLGPPWWFHDSLNGMRRFRDQAMETAGIYNTAGFNDDTRAFCSIPARHDLARRVDADWLAGLAARGVIDREEAREMIMDLAGGLARRAYRLS
jgi:glucuronate isomerase